MNLTYDEQKLLNLDLKSFPLMAAASAAAKGCSTCPHKKANSRAILRAAATRMLGNKRFIQFLKQHLKLPVVIGGITFTE